jgi:kynureninase
VDLTTRAAATRLDSQDVLASFRDRFLHVDPDLIYLDGNSLGRLPLATIDRIATVLRDEWGDRLIRGWPESWFDLRWQVGDQIYGATVDLPAVACWRELTAANPDALVILSVRDSPSNGGRA